MGLIGGDACVRRLAPLVRQWPSEGRSARAQSALDILCAIGSDLALMHLDDIARTVKSRALRDHANDRLQRVAETRGLSVDDLADRLVPDLGLGRDGSLTIQIGVRCFTVGFDDQLRPFVHDPSGARLKELPATDAGDGAAAARLASERWKRLKKDARSVMAAQIQRLEALMCNGRPLQPNVFERFFVHHPLVGRLARPLLWGAVGDDGAVNAFRIAEDASFADEQDRDFQLPASCRIRLLHPLELDAAQRAAWTRILSDYRILPPFPQLDREIVQMAANELGHSHTARFEGKQVATGSVIGLERSGWRPPADKESGHIGWFEKPLGEGTCAVLMLEPGIPVHSIRERPVQTFGVLSLQRFDIPVAFERIDRVTRSELLRDLDRLPAA
jgi:hypothetical protein